MDRNYKFPRRRHRNEGGACTPTTTTTTLSLIFRFVLQVVVLCVLAVSVIQGAVVPAPALIRTPSLDSAVVKSDRVGGNFAYSTLEGHAYTAVAPVVQKVVQPVVVRQTYYPPFIGTYFPSQPVFANPIFGGFPGSGGPAQPAPAAPPSPPLTGTPVDEDTVAVEAA